MLSLTNLQIVRRIVHGVSCVVHVTADHSDTPPPGNPHTGEQCGAVATVFNMLNITLFFTLVLPPVEPRCCRDRGQGIAPWSSPRASGTRRTHGTNQTQVGLALAPTPESTKSRENG